MVQEAVVTYSRDQCRLRKSSWLTLEEQHERQAQARIVHEKLSSMNGGQEFVYTFNKIIQRGWED